MKTARHILLDCLSQEIRRRSLLDERNCDRFTRLSSGNHLEVLWSFGGRPQAKITGGSNKGLK